MPTTPRPHRRARLLLATATGAVALPALGAAGALSGAASATTASPYVRVGAVPAPPPGAARSGALNPGRRLPVDVVLEPRGGAAGLAAYATAVSTPGSAAFHRYLSPAAFAARFGASATTVARVEHTLSGMGLSGLRLSADHLMVTSETNAATAERAFDTPLFAYRLRGGSAGFANAAALRLPRALAGEVVAVVGLDSLRTARPDGLEVARDAGTPPSPQASAAGAPAITSNCYNALVQSGVAAATPNEIASAYGMDALWGNGDLGGGSTIALFELAPFLSPDVAAFEACYGLDNTVQVVPVDGGGGNPTTIGLPIFGEVEAELDIETAMSLAPGATIDVYEAPDNSDAAVLDEYAAAVENPQVNIISTSWGSCESPGEPGVIAENLIFEQAAVEGKTVLAASGDSGSEDCYDSFTGTGTALAVDDPASQPYVTGVGGSQIMSLGPPPSEVAWDSNGGASGGGISANWHMPSYQSGAAASLGLVGPWSACANGSGNCREVPDVAADAGTPFYVYCSETIICGSTGLGGWTPVYGTSLAVPIWAALVALTDASKACAGRAVGFANPRLYAVASGPGYASAFNDITSGTNDLGFHTGSYDAGPGYSLVTGLGTPIAGSGSGTDKGLVSALCAH